MRQHSGVITVRNYSIGEIYLGTDRFSIGRLNNIDEYHFNYLSNNYILAHICQHLIDFIDDGSHIKYRKTGNPTLTVIVPADRKQIPSGTFHSILTNQYY